VAAKVPFAPRKALDDGEVSTSRGNRRYQQEYSRLRDTYNAVPDHPEYTAWVKRAQAFASKKEAGLYVDFDDKDEPTTVAGQETATECLAYARAEVERLGIAEVVKRGRAKT
jgi:hypothetical protein